MTPMRHLRSGLGWVAACAGVVAAAYATYAAVAWWRYGAVQPPEPGDEDLLLDRVLPVYDVIERHHIAVAAPAPVTFAAAREMDLLQRPLVRAIFRARELMLGTTPDDRSRPRGLLADVQSLGWGILAERPGREVVVGAVTRPWEPNVTFRSMPPDEFRAFAEPGFVKIAWTLRADAAGPDASVFRTETRAVATDPEAGARFRRYWAFLSPGIILIRWLSLGPLKADAERRGALSRPAGGGISPPPARSGAA